MGKESKSGTKFYTDKGMRTITIHVPRDVHARLVRYSRREFRSLQKTVQKLVLDFDRKLR